MSNLYTFLALIVGYGHKSTQLTQKQIYEICPTLCVDAHNSPKFILYSMRKYCLSKPIQKFKALFMQYDENSDGSLDTTEIHNGILRMGFDVPLSTAADVMSMIDLDGNATLDFAEFRCAILNERIAKDFEDHTRRMHNDCKLQDAYLKRCAEPPFAASQIGPAR